MAKNLAEPKEDNGSLDDDYSDSSYDLALNTMSTLFFDQEHISQLMPAVERSKDPARVVGTALGQIAQVAYNKLNQADLGVSDKVWVSDEGVIDSSIEEVLEFFQEAGFELDPQAVAMGTAAVLKDSPIAQGEGVAQPTQQPAGQMAAPVGAMQ